MEATMLFPRFAQSAAALVLLTIGLAAPAHAQNNKQIISGTWYEDRAVGNNSSPNFLLLNFTQTPANQFLNITNVSCNVTVPSAAVINAVTLIAGSTSGAENLGRPYEIKGNVTPETSGSSKYYSIVQNGIFYKFGPGRFPTIEIDAQSTSALSIGAIGANCVIVGNLTEN
jgi:hypothetical protein